MAHFEFKPELHLRDKRVVRNSDDALEIVLSCYMHTPGRDEVLHWLETARTPGQISTARLVFVAWLQERGLIAGTWHADVLTSPSVRSDGDMRWR